MTSATRLLVGATALAVTSAQGASRARAVSCAHLPVSYFCGSESAALKSALRAVAIALGLIGETSLGEGADIGRINLDCGVEVGQGADEVAFGAPSVPRLL